MKTLLAFELLKLIKKKKNVIAVSAFIALLVIYIVVGIVGEGMYWNMQMTVCKEELTEAENIVNSIKSSPKTSDPKKEPLKSAVEEQSILLARETAVSDNDWKAFLGTEIQEDKDYLNGIMTKSEIVGEDPGTLRADIDKYQYMISHNIQPVHEINCMQSFFFLKNACKDIFPLFFVILLFILTSDIVSGEIDGGTYKLLFTQPVKKRRILLSKFLASVIYCLVLSAALFGSLFVILGLTHGFGNMDYPVIFDRSSMNAVWNFKSADIVLLPICRFVLYMLPMLLLAVISTAAASIFTSSLFKSSVSSVSFPIIFCVAMYLFTFQMKIIAPAAPFLPLTYTNVPGILDGSTAQALGTSVTYPGGVITLIIYALIFYAASAVLFKRRQV